MRDKGPPSNTFHAQDVVILGLGPAGRAAASACAAQGLAVTAVDPHPWAPWRATYGAWTDELPEGAPCAATVGSPAAWTSHRQVITRAYSMLDTQALQHSLDLSAVEVLADTATADGQCLADGAPLRARITTTGAADRRNHRRGWDGSRRAASHLVAPGPRGARTPASRTTEHLRIKPSRGSRLLRGLLRAAGCAATVLPVRPRGPHGHSHGDGDGTAPAADGHPAPRHEGGVTRLTSPLCESGFRTMGPARQWSPLRR